MTHTYHNPDDTMIPDGTRVLELENTDTGRKLWRFFRSHKRLVESATKERASRSGAWALSAFRAVGRGEDQYTEDLRLFGSNTVYGTRAV